MNVNSISLFNQDRSKLGYTQIGESKKDFVETHYQHAPKKYQSSSISFGHKIASTVEKLQFRNMSGIPCPVCAREMIPKIILDFIAQIEEAKFNSTSAAVEKLSKFKTPWTVTQIKTLQVLKKISETKPDELFVDLLKRIFNSKKQDVIATVENKRMTPENIAKKVIKEIQKREKSMRPAEREIFSKLKKSHRNNPEKSLQDLTQILRLSHSKKFKQLKPIQFKFLDEIDATSKKLSEEVQKKFSGVIGTMPEKSLEVTSALTAAENNMLRINRKVIEFTPEELLANLLKKMPKYERSHLLDEIKYKKITPKARSKKMISELNKYEKSMHPIEHEVFTQLKRLHRNHPEKNLQELITVLRPNNVRRLKKIQNKILNDINLTAINLSKESKQKVLAVTNTVRKILEEGPDPFKKKTFMREIAEVTRNLPEKEIADKIYRLATSVPSSGNDVSAFIVKYSGTVPDLVDGVYKEFPRSSREIAQRLLSPSVGTHEHIRANTPSKKGHARGESHPKNYLLQCYNCNNKRLNMPFDQWVRLHPEIIDNVQKYIDVIIDRINNNQIKNYAWYPVAVAKTLYEESKGLIKLDISKLKKAPETDTQRLLERFNKVA